MVTRRHRTLRPLLHSRQPRCISSSLVRYALPSMRFKCTLETLRNCTESSPHSFSFPFARDAFSSFDRAPHSTQPLPLPPHARLNVSVQHGVNGKIRKPERISDAYLLPRFTSRPRERTLLLERRREREKGRVSSETKLLAEGVEKFSKKLLLSANKL